MTRTALALIMTACLAAPAAAQSRPDTLTMSCAQAQAMVNKAGAIVLGTGPNVYDRYVKDQLFCGPGEIARPEFVRSKDQAACMVGYLCRSYSRSY